MSVKNNNQDAYNKSEDSFILSARVNKETFKIPLKLSVDLEAPIEAAASDHHLTIQQYVLLAIKEQLKKDGKL